MLVLGQIHAKWVKDETGMAEFGLEMLHSLVPPSLPDNMGIVLETIATTANAVVYSVGRYLLCAFSEMLDTGSTAMQSRCHATELTCLKALQVSLILVSP